MARGLEETAVPADEKAHYHRFMGAFGAISLIAVAGIVAGSFSAGGDGQGRLPFIAAMTVAALAVITAFLAGLASYSSLMRRFGSWQKAQTEGSSLDELTGIANKSSIQSRLDEEALRAKRTSSSFACAVLDIDGLGKINEEFGHGDGDSVVKGVAALLRDRLRSYDFVGRYDGDEFVIILPGIDIENGVAACERLRAAVEKNAGDRGGLDYVKVTATFGVAAWDAAQDDGEHILRRAEAALHRAREQGRNRTSA